MDASVPDDMFPFDGFVSISAARVRWGQTAISCDVAADDANTVAIGQMHARHPTPRLQRSCGAPHGRRTTPTPDHPTKAAVALFDIYPAIISDLTAAFVGSSPSR